MLTFHLLWHSWYHIWHTSSAREVKLQQLMANCMSHNIYSFSKLMDLWLASSPESMVNTAIFHALLYPQHCTTQSNEWLLMTISTNAQHFTQLQTPTTEILLWSIPARSLGVRRNPRDVSTVACRIGETSASCVSCPEELMRLVMIVDAASRSPLRNNKPATQVKNFFEVSLTFHALKY
jgi:hypothetical protein